MSSEDPRERENLCGRELVSEEPLVNLAEKYDSDTWYEDEEGNHYCRREIWEGADTGLCIWHADVVDKPSEELLQARLTRPERLDRAIFREVDFPTGMSFAGCRLWEADFSDAYLGEARLSNVHLRRANLSGSFLYDADISDASLLGADLNDANLENADLSDTDFWGADLSGAVFWEANLRGAYFRDADLSGAMLGGANLQSTVIHGANLSGANLRGTDFGKCEIHMTIFENISVDESTTFGTLSGYEIEADAVSEDESRLASRVSNQLRAFGRPSTEPDQLEKAETQYRTIQRLRREHDLKQDPKLEISEKHARRKKALADRRYCDWLKLAVYRWSMGYGEKPWHVVWTSLAVILVSALLYPLAGIRVDGAERTYPAVLADPAGTAVETVRVVAESVYFSTVTFTTLGYGDVEPVGWAKALSTVESFLGALLMALLVYVLGRRATW